MTATRISGTRTAYVTAALALLVLAAALACTPPRQGAPQADSGTRRGSGGTNAPEHLHKPSLLLVSVDGLRADYLDRTDVPNLRRLVTRGTRAEALRPVFPTTTFPNHYSLVTGLHPERHGIVENSFFDPVRDAAYSFRNPLTAWDGSWYGGEPLWVTAERQGMVAACFFWPGSEADIRGVRPTYWTRYDATIPNSHRVQRVLEWLRMPTERRPRFITLYFSDVDAASHRAPLGSDEISRALHEVDTAIGELLDGVDRISSAEGVILLLTSDHGMANTSGSRVMQLEDLTDTRGIRTGYSGPVTGLHVGPEAGDATAVRDRINARLRHGRAYLRGELPRAFRFGGSPRAGDVVIVMEEGWMVATSVFNRSLISREWAEHGWDPVLPSMRASFVIAGRGIPQGRTISEVDNVDVYPLVTELLGLASPSSIDGRPGHIQGLIDAAR